MNLEEARERIGFSHVASVRYAIKTGKIKARESGDIVESSVLAFIERRDRQADVRALFLKDDLTPDETKRLRGSGSKK